MMYQNLPQEMRKKNFKQINFVPKGMRKGKTNSKIRYWEKKMNQSGKLILPAFTTQRLSETGKLNCSLNVVENVENRQTKLQLKMLNKFSFESSFLVF